MPPSHLKIMFKVSDHSVVNFVELTSDMLEYNGNLKLEKYLIFDPTIHFNHALKQKILEMTYDKKIEVFFNTQTFLRKIVKSTELRDEEKEKTDTNIIEKERIQANASFEFIIQCIFCTGLPLPNYYKTMEFYDVEATKNKVIAKRSSSVFDYINPTPHKKCFSYIKCNGKKYTVTGLTWINDVLNHPVYMDIIAKYKKYDIERKKVDPSKNEKELNTKLNSLILDIYDLDSFTTTSIGSSKYDSSKDKDLVAARQRLQKLFKGIKGIEKKEILTLFNLTINDPDAALFIGSYRKIKAEYEKEKNSIKKPHRLRELIFIYNAIIQSNEKHKVLNTILENFNNDSNIKGFKSEIKSICTVYTDDELYNIIRGTTYYPSLMKYFRTLKMLFLKEDMYDIILNDLTYQDRNPSEIKEMDMLIEKEVKNYYDYRQAFKKIEEDRVLSNEHWKKEADLIHGEAGMIENDDLIKSESLFDIILKCDNNNKTCQNNINKSAVSYLEIGLEQINKNDKTSFTYEAYINLEVAEGVYDESNYHKLMCPYMSNVLGDSYDEMIKKEGQNIFMRNRVFIKSTSLANKENKTNIKTTLSTVNKKRVKRDSRPNINKRRTKKRFFRRK